MRKDQTELSQFNQKTGFFEILIACLYEMICKDGDVCVDAGANFGDHTFGMIRAVSPRGRVHAIEALPHLATRLIRIASKNSNPLDVYNLAVSDRKGTARFHYVKDIVGNSGLYIRDYASQGKTVDLEIIDVELNRIDFFLSDIPTWRFFKLDIEFSEFHAIRGAQSLIRKHGPFITFENGGPHTASIAGYTKEEWFELFSYLNYRPYDLYGYEITPERWSSDRSQPYNSIAVPIGSADEDFVVGAWRNEIDIVIDHIKRGLRKWPPSPAE